MLVLPRAALVHSRSSEMIPAAMMHASNRPSERVVAGRMPAGYRRRLDGVSDTGVETAAPALPSASGVMVI